MDGGQRSRRRRGRRGGQNRPRDDAEARAPGPPPGPPGPPDADLKAPRQGEEEPRPQPRRRQDTRRIRHGGEAPSEHENGGGASRIHRRPPPERSQSYGRGSARGNDGRSPERGPRDRQRDLRPRTYEAPVPQDERSVELGARFREAQAAVRDAQKTLDKRKAEQGDEPQWLIDELTAAEQRFEEAATTWSDHLATTGRKVVRR